MVVNMEIGMITPPVGLNLFVTAGVANMSVLNVVRAALPWVGIMFLFLVLVTYVPWLSTFLPTSLMGPEIIHKVMWDRLRETVRHNREMTGCVRYGATECGIPNSNSASKPASDRRSRGEHVRED